MESSTYICAVCGKKHSYYYSVEAPEPDVLADNDSNEIMAYGPWRLVGKKYVLTQASLFVSIMKSEFYFHWKIWVKLSLPDFFDMVDNNRDAVDAELVDDLYFYKNTKRTTVRLQLSFHGKTEGFPKIDILDDRTELSIDFKNGITQEKFKRWMEQLQHPVD